MNFGTPLAPVKKLILTFALSLVTLFGAQRISAQTGNVELSMSHTSAPGATNASVSVTGFADNSWLTSSGLGSQRSEIRNLPMLLDETQVLTITTLNVETFRLELKPPGQFATMIENVRRRSYQSTPGASSSSQMIRITLVKRGARGPGSGEPLGEATSIGWGMPRDSHDTLPDQGPYLSFNLGSARNGEALPPLRIPLRYHSSAMEEMTLPQAADITADAGPEFQLYAPQTNVRQELDPNGPGCFWIKFAPPYTTTPFVTYYFEPSGSPNAAPTQIKVTKTIDGAVYETLIKGSFSPAGVTSWTIEDWHRRGRAIKKVITGQKSAVSYQGPVPEPGEYWGPDIYTYQIKVLPFEGSSEVVSEKKFEYRGYVINHGSHSSPAYHRMIVPTQVVEGPGDGDYTTALLHHPSHGGMSGTILPTGQTRIEDANGHSVNSNGTATWQRGTSTYETWLDSQPTFNPQQNPPIQQNGSLRTNVFLEADPRWSDFEWPATIERKVGPALVSKSVTTYEEQISGGHTLVVSTLREHASSDPNGSWLETKKKIYRPDATDTVVRDQIYSEETAAGIKRSYVYEAGLYQGNGVFSPGPTTHPDLRITILSGTATGGVTATGLGTAALDPIGLHVGKSTKSVEFLQSGHLMRREVSVYTGGGGAAPIFELLSWENFLYTKDGRLSSRTASNGASYTATWTGSLRVAERDETDLVTTLNYDVANRLIAVTQPQSGSLAAQRTEFEYDAANRVRYQRVGPYGGEQIITETIYDRGDRIRRVKAPGQGSSNLPGAITTEYGYPNGGRHLQVIYQAGSSAAATKTITRHADGRLASITGTASVHEYLSYDFDPAGRPRLTHQFGPQKKRTLVTISDLLGRVLEERRNGFGPDGGTRPLITFREYNPRGLPNKIFTVEHAPHSAFHVTSDHLLEYDEFGELNASGLDLDSNGRLDPSSADRFTAADTRFVNENGSWWLRSSRKRYHTANSSAFQEARTDTRLTPLAGVLAQTVNYDYQGNATRHSVVTNTPMLGRRLLSLQPDGSTQERFVTGGFLTIERWFDNQHQQLNGSPTLSKAYSYDAQGRVSHVQDAGTGTAVMQYHFGTSLLWRQHDARNLLVAIRTYDEAGRVARIQDPAGWSQFSYNARGEVTEEAGTNSYPIRRDYNDYGALKELRTYRNGLGGAADVTAWNYDDNTGWLVAKTDAASKMVTYDYSYSSGFQDVIRTWARPADNPIFTTYRYALQTGDLVRIDYSDNTPDIVYSQYNRDGSVREVSDATGSRTLHYQNGQRTSEYLPSWFNNLVLTSNYEAKTSPSDGKVGGRYLGFQLGYDSDADPSTPSGDVNKEYSTTYGFDNLGRINGVTAAYPARGVRSPLSVAASYSYKPNSSIWNQLTQGNYEFKRTFEDNRDILTKAEAKLTLSGSPTVIASYGYQSDNVGRLEWAKQEGAAFNDGAPTTYTRFGYNPQRPFELTGAKGYRGIDPASTSDPLPGRSFSYGHDDAGNRTGVAVDTDSVIYRNDVNGQGSPGANALNQTLSRGTLKTRVSGTAHPSTTVSVGGISTNRSDRYWDIALPNYSQSTQLGVTASISGGSPQNGTVNVLTRPVTETFRYDESGNLIEDSLWIYEWDAENRLKRMFTNPSVNWSGSVRELIFTYDYLGRRVRKVSKENAATTYDRKFIYDGWTLLAEMDSATNKVVQSYVWGLGVDGSLGSSGGGGALVLETIHNDIALTPFHVIADGRGNVTALINYTTGAMAAAYEYGPFGEKVRSEIFEPSLSHQPFGHATKFTDRESGLVYYGYRFYDPSLGRFLNRDPLEETGGVNLYAFVRNSPVNAWDYLGLAENGGSFVEVMPSETKVVWLPSPFDDLQFLQSLSEDLGDFTTEGSSSPPSATLGREKDPVSDIHYYKVGPSPRITSADAANKGGPIGGIRVQLSDGRTATLINGQFIFDKSLRFSIQLNAGERILLKAFEEVYVEAPQQLLYDSTIGSYKRGEDHFEESIRSFGEEDYALTILHGLAGIGEAVSLGLLGSGTVKPALAAESKLRTLTKAADNYFPDNPNSMLLGIPRTSKGYIEPNSYTRIRPEKHALKLGETYSPRHHGQHYHVEVRSDPIKSWNNTNNVTKQIPPGYIPGKGTGFLPGEKFPGSP